MYPRLRLNDFITNTRQTISNTIEATRATLGTIRDTRATLGIIGATRAALEPLETTEATILRTIIETTTSTLASIETTRATLGTIRDTRATLGIIGATRAALEPLETTEATILRTIIEATTSTLASIETTRTALGTVIEETTIRDSLLTTGITLGTIISSIGANRATVGTIEATEIALATTLETLIEAAREIHIAREIRNIDAMWTQDEIFFNVASSEVTDNPIKVFIDLFEMLQRNSIKLLPQSIYYNDSVGIDVGGITRSFITSLVKSFCNPIYHLVEATSEGVIPLIDNQNISISLEDQEKCFKVMGRIFSGALLNYHSIVIGQHFNPIVFKMIFHLNEYDLANIDSPEVYNKMVKIYLLEQFKGREDLAKDLFRDNITEELRDVYFINSKDEFIEENKLDKKIQATLIIAKSMYDTLFNKTIWNILKGRSENVLRKNIQGAISKDIVINAFQINNVLGEKSVQYIKRWIEENAEHPECLQKLVEAISGLITIDSRTKLQINIVNGNDKLPIFHTCMFAIDLSKYSTYESFKEKLDLALEYCFLGSGYQNA